MKNAQTPEMPGECIPSFVYRSIVLIFDIRVHREFKYLTTSP